MPINPTINKAFMRDATTLSAYAIQSHISWPQVGFSSEKKAKVGRPETCALLMEEFTEERGENNWYGVLKE